MILPLVTSGIEHPAFRPVARSAITTRCPRPTPVTPLTPLRGTCLPSVERRHPCATPSRRRTLPAPPTAPGCCLQPARRGRDGFGTNFAPPTVEWRFDRHGGVAMQSAARVVAIAFLAALAGCVYVSIPDQPKQDPGHHTTDVDVIHRHLIVYTSN